MNGDWSLRPIAGSVGLEIAGADLQGGLQPADVSALQTLLARHGVVILTAQHLDDDGHARVARQLGEIRVPSIFLPSLVDAGHPEISVISTENGLAAQTERWHTDVTWVPDPPRYSILSMRVCPPAGGDTMWSSQVAAYAQLSAAMRSFLIGMTAQHEAGPQTAVHPVVIRHPITGRPSLFVNSIFTRRICELSDEESSAVLSFLFAHSVQPAWTCRWRWSEGDLAVWDNQFVQHYAVNDYAPASRRIHRIEITGAPPIPWTVADEAVAFAG